MIDWDTTFRDAPPRVMVPWFDDPAQGINTPELPPMDDPTPRLREGLWTIDDPEDNDGRMIVRDAPLAGLI